MKTNTLTPELLDKRDAYWRTANYLSGGQIYLYDNPLQSPSAKTSQPGQEMKIMKIQINTDNHITGREALVAQAEATITDALGHLADHITRVEVHLSDENGEKTGGRDKRCLMEARLEGHQPIVVTDESGSLDGAITGAADKLKGTWNRTLGRLTDR